MNYTNIYTIADKLTKHPLMEDLSIESVIDYAVEFIRIMGVPNTFLEKVEQVEVNDFRGELPCDFYEMIQVRYNHPKKPVVVNEKYPQVNNVTNTVVSRCNYCKYVSNRLFTQCPNCGSTDVVQTSEPMHYPQGVINNLEFVDVPMGGVFTQSTDSFHMSHDNSGTLTYKLQGNCIFTSVDNCIIDVAYRALPTDEDGYPLIPDNGSYERALELYIKLRYFTILFDLGKITPAVLQNTQREYHTAVNSAYTGMLMPSLDQMEVISRMWNRMLPDKPLDHETGYKYMGSRQFIKVH